MSLGFTPVEEIIAAGRLLAARGMIAGSGGNISVRLDPGRILITRAGAAKGRLTGNDLVVVSTPGGNVSGDAHPSSELLMHLAVYQERPEIMACVHSHPPYATAFSVAGRALDAGVLPEIALTVGPIALTEFAPTGTSAVPQSLAPCLKNHDAFLLANHGLLTIGRSLEDALNCHEVVEHLAQVLAIADTLGKIRPLPPEEIERLDRLRRVSRLS